MSNVKQIALSTLMYTQDYDEWLPPYMYANPADPQLLWFQVLQPYLKSNQVLFCPSDSASDSTQPPIWNNISYAWNANYLWPPPYTSIPLATISAPSQTVLVGDSQGTISGVTNSFGMDAASLLLSPPRHLGGMNMGFVDGHVKWFKVPRVLTADNALWNTTGAP